MEVENGIQEDTQSHPTDKIESVVNGLTEENPVHDSNLLTENEPAADVKMENKAEITNEIKEENEVSNGVSADEEHNKSNFLDNIALGTESEGENGDDKATGKKYTDEDAVRRVLVKGINRKKTADDIEDYFFDNYSDSGIEEVFACFVPGKKKWFNGAAIITFETEVQAQKFLNMELKNEEEIAFKQKLYRICLADNKKKREAKKNEMEKQKVSGENVETATNSRTIVCTGFAGVAHSLAEVQNYLRDNHENVVNVFVDQKKTFLTFTDHKAANKFLSLSYVKFKGVYIIRRWGEDARRGEKRKVEMTDPRSGYQQQGALKGAQFKLKGFKNTSTNYRSVKQSLEQNGVDRKDVRFINYSTENMEAVVILHTAKARDIVLKLNKSGLVVNGDRIVAQFLTGSEEDKFLQYSSAKRQQNKAKRDNDWSDY